MVVEGEKKRKGKGKKNFNGKKKSLMGKKGSNVGLNCPWPGELYSTGLYWARIDLLTRTTTTTTTTRAGGVIYCSRENK